MELGIKRSLVSKCPLESLEQKALIKWARASTGTHPELAFLYAIPNGGRRNAREAKTLKDEGVLRGVSDMFLPVRRGEFNGLYIELKRRDGGVVSREQKDFINFVTTQGFRAEVCRGFIPAKELILNYFNC